jgi:hypothetical protein
MHLHTLVERNKLKIQLNSEKYQMAWEAKLQLVGGDPAKVGRQILQKGDIRCMEDVEELVRDADKQKVQAERRRQHEGVLQRDREPPLFTAGEEVERTAQGGESMRVMSWICTGVGLMGNDADIEDGEFFG